MGPVIEIRDANDPRLGEYVRLRDVALRTRFECPHGLFIAEGERILARALRAGFRPRSVLTQRAFLPTLAPLLTDDSTPVYVVDAATVEAVTGFPVHRGSLASMHRKPESAPQAVLAAASRVVVLEDVVNPTNLGAIVRSAAGLGMEAAILTPRCADPLYRRAVRVSMGEVFHLPYARLASWPSDLELLRAHGFSVVALTPAPGAVPLDAFDPDALPRLALLVGTEGPGLSDRALAAADAHVRIPMSAGVDSLNVAAAAAVACWAMGRRASRVGGQRNRCG